MTDNDDKLLMKFFTKERQEIADNGFSERVMRRLPDHSQRLSAIWSTLGYALAIMLFIATGGLHAVVKAVMQTFGNMIQNGMPQLELPAAVTVIAVLTALFCHKVTSLDY